MKVHHIIKIFVPDFIASLNGLTEDWKLNCDVLTELAGKKNSFGPTSRLSTSSKNIC